MMMYDDKVFFGSSYSQKLRNLELIRLCLVLLNRQNCFVHEQKDLYTVHFCLKKYHFHGFFKGKNRLESFCLTHFFFHGQNDFISASGQGTT